MKMKRFATTVATMLVGAFALAACTTPDATPPAATPAPGQTAPAGEGGAETLTPVQGGTISVAMTNTPNGIIDVFPNAANNTIIYLTQGPGFAFFDQDLNYVRNTDFGTFELVGQTADTMTVRYTINEGVQWSDGTPVDAADMILWWAANNDRFDHIEVGADAAATVVPNDANFIPGSTSISTSGEFPIISDDGRTITFTYNQTRSDWYFLFGSSSVPAHIVARRALGIQDPEEAKQALITALGGPENFRAQDGTEVPTVVSDFNHDVQRDSELNPILDAAGNRIPVLADSTITTFVTPDSDAIGRIAQVYNDDWFFTSFDSNSDQDLTITQGPFRLVEWVEGEFMRLERNPNFTAHGSVVTVPAVDEITVRFIGDPMAQVMALQNGEVDIIMPQTSVDTLAAVQALNGVHYMPMTIGTYEHVTLMMNNGGPFDPAHWGGNADTARAVRNAFLHTLPYDDIINLLVRQEDPNAVLRQSFLQVPGAPDYDTIVAGNESAVFQVQDLELARQILVDAGLEDQLPINVRFLYGNNATRRANQFELIRAAAPDLFNVIDNGSPDWGTILRSGDGSFDAALFGWGSTSTSPANAEATYVTGGINNIGGFDNAEVNRLWAEVIASTDQNEIVELQRQIEEILWTEGFGAPIFQWPGIIAWRDNVQNVSAIPFSIQWAWNFWEWNLAN